MLRKKERPNQAKLKGPVLYLRNSDQTGISRYVYRPCCQHTGNDTPDVHGWTRQSVGVRVSEPVPQH